MAPGADPYRTLGLARGAPISEVKKAYRRLAKANHPDAAGPDALPRFLAIQEAYDLIVGPGTGPAAAARPGQPRRPWDADPDRADATRRAYGGRARRSRPSSGRGGAGQSGGRSGPADRAAPPPGDDDRGTGRPPNKATLGSTSYDGADAEPFEPDWGGASWYGTTSGTYWTLNPKEYADPRKHGPEYQARARRATHPTPGTTPDEGSAGTVDASMGSPDEATAPPTHTTASWWEATAGPEATENADGHAPDDAGGGPGAAREGGGAGDVPYDDRAASSPVASSWFDGILAGHWGWIDGVAPRLPVRIGRAVLGWIPIALAIGWVAGEASGCGRFSAACEPSIGAVGWLLQIALLAVLLISPRIAGVAAIGAVTAIAIAIPSSLVLSAPGADGASGGAVAVLAGLIVIAWLVGVGVGVVRVLRVRPEPLS